MLGHIQSIQQFNIVCGILDRKEGNKVTMYCDRAHHGDNVFSYDYDALCRQFLRFNADGTVDEWHDCVDLSDTKNREPDDTHAHIDAWMKSHLEAVMCPA